MNGQQAGALLVGDAKQRSALHAFPRDKLLVDPGGVVGGAVRVTARSARGQRRVVRLECEREVSQWRRQVEVGALELTLARALSSCRRCSHASKNTAVHIKDLTLGKLEHAATPGTALGVDGAVCAQMRFASQQRCVDSDACRAELASRCCQQLLAVRAMLASVGDGRADESSDLLLAVCPTLLAAGDAPARGLSITNVRASAD
jgi:hypothetical protein